MKLRKSNFIILIVITSLVLYFSLKDEFFDIVMQIRKANIFFILLALFSVLLYWMIEAKTLQLMVFPFKKDLKYKKILKNTIITQFFHGITPFATGGQPAQIYLLTTEGIPAVSASNASVQNFIVYQLVLVLLGAFALIYNWITGLFNEIALLDKLTIIGFLINFLVIASLLTITFFPRFNSFLINGIINIFAKLNFIKNKEKHIKRWRKRNQEFYENAFELRHNKELAIKSFILNILKLTLFYLIPVFLFYSVGIMNVSPIKVIVASAYVALISAFIPLPGGSGGAEYSFIAFFGVLVKGYQLAAIMLLWRFITYYFGLFLGGLTLVLTNKKRWYSENRNFYRYIWTTN